MNILQIQYIQEFVLKSGDSIHEHTNNNGPNLKLKNLYGNSIMNCMKNHGTLKFNPAHINFFLVETWEAFKL